MPVTTRWREQQKTTYSLHRTIHADTILQSSLMIIYRPQAAFVYNFRPDLHDGGPEMIHRSLDSGNGHQTFQRDRL